MSWRPPCSTPTDTLFPYTSLCRSEPARHRRPSRPRPGRRPPVLPEGTGVGSGAADRLPELRLPRRARGPLRGGAEERRQGDRADLLAADRRDRTSVVLGKSVSVRVDLGGHRLLKKKNNINYK